VSASESGSRRQLVPRWRPWRTTARLGESGSSTPRIIERSGFDKEQMLSRYRARPQSGRAAELLSAALIHEHRSDEIDAVAEDHLNSGRVLIAELAAAALMDPEERARRAALVERENPRARIARLKVVLNREPRNAVRWVDIAREYTVLAQPAKAIKAMRVALALLPESRFVLRSAAALYVQVGDKEGALRLLEGTPRRTADPWLMAPYVAISDLADHKLRHHRDAIRLLNDGNMSVRDLAELAAALGTSELNSGSGRRGRQLLRQSAEIPTENSLAQIEWVSAHLLRARLVGGTPIDVLRDFEAHSRHAAYVGRWDDAVASASNWLADQPFSADAACFGSFAAWMAEDWTLSYKLADDGLIANPGNPVLLNNAAVALVELGDLERAVKLLTVGRSAPGDRRDRAVLTATEGLLFFRSGLVEEGRRRYDQTIGYFESQHDRQMAARAALILAREEILASTSEAEASWRRADRLVNASPTADLATLKARISSLGFGRTRQLDLLPGSADPLRQSLLALCSSQKAGIHGR